MSRGWLSRILALLLLAAVLSAGALVYLMAWTQWQRNQTELAEQLDQYDRLRSIAGYSAKDITVAEQSDALKTVVLGDGPQAVVAADLQSRLREIADQNAIQIVQVSDLPMEKQHGGVSKLGVHAEMTGQIGNLENLLGEIGKSTPWLFVDNVQVRSGFGNSAEQLTEPPASMGVDVWGLVPAQAAVEQ